MKRFLLVALSLLAIAVPMLALVTWSDAGQADSIVRLQQASPGVQQIGNANLSGMIKAGSFSGSGSGLSAVPWAAIVGAPGTLLTLPYSGSGNLSGGLFDITNSNTNANASALKGSATGATGLVYGLYGLTSSTSGRGVFGSATAATGGTVGVYGSSDSTSGRGLFGLATSLTGVNYGVIGWSQSASGRGIYGFASEATGVNYGLFAESASPSGYGVYGRNATPSGAAYGGFFESASPTGIALKGSANSASGASTGAHGLAASTSGTGVLGEATAASGTTYGVRGVASSPDGFGVFGSGGTASSGWAGYFSGRGYFGEAVGIGTTTPNEMLDVEGTVKAHGQGAPAFIAWNDSTYAPPPYPGIGLYSYASSSGSNVMGVYAVADGVDSAAKRGVYATVKESASAFNLAIGVDGVVASPVLTGSSPKRGVSGYASAPSGSTVPRYGVYGDTSGDSGSRYSIYGDSPGAGGTPYAGYFAANVHVTGTLSKAAGAFKIDHPLDPFNKYLWHSFVESPDMLNLYTGEIVTDEQGYATVLMPEWFEALNRDFRYQLTVLDETDSESFVMAKVVRRMKDRRFVIRTSEPRIAVSWQITGIRHDPYANAHRIPSEELKSSEERGTLLHPTERGFDESYGTDWRRKHWDKVQAPKP